jgi:hypothetical protein
LNFNAHLDVRSSDRNELIPYLLKLAAVVALILLAIGYYSFRVAPLANAERFVRSEGIRGFEEVFSTPSVFGNMTAPFGDGGGKVFPQRENSVDIRRFKIEDSSLSLFGGSARFQIRHVVFLNGYEVDLTHQIDLTLESGSDDSWRYDRFVVKGRGPVDLVTGENPFGSALELLLRDRGL